MIRLAAMAIEEADKAKGCLLPRSNSSDISNSQHLLLECLSKRCPQEIVVEVCSQVSHIIERLIEHLDPCRIPFANPVLRAKHGGEEILSTTIQM
jgi:hypothetical protein